MALTYWSGTLETLGQSVQGSTLKREHVDEIRSTSRRVSKGITLKEMFEIVNVDPTSENGFTISVRSAVSGKTFLASLVERTTSDATKRIIRDAAWNKQKVVLQITGRLLGDQILNARAIQASGVPAQNLSIHQDFRTASATGANYNPLTSDRPDAIAPRSPPCRAGCRSAPACHATRHTIA